MTRTVSNDESHLVLRTIHIPKNLDDELRVAAFRQSTSKSELIRIGIRLVLKEIASNGNKVDIASNSRAVAVAAD